MKLTRQQENQLNLPPVFLSFVVLLSCCEMTTKTILSINNAWHLLCLNTKNTSYKLPKTGKCEELPVKHTTGWQSSLRSKLVPAEDLTSGATVTETLVINIIIVWQFSINISTVCISLYTCFYFSGHSICCVHEELYLLCSKGGEDLGLNLSFWKYFVFLFGIRKNVPN